MRLVVGWNILKAWLLARRRLRRARARSAGRSAASALVSLLVFFGLLVVGAAYWYADRVVARDGRRARAAARRGAGRSTRRSSGWPESPGSPKPRLYLLPDGHPRALAAGRGPRGAAIAVSRGLLAAATPAELEGVLAHELAHIRNRDVLVQTLGGRVRGGACSRRAASAAGSQRALLFVLGPLAAALVHLLLSPKREFAADRAAAALCGSPHGLADALIRLEQATELVEFRANPATEPLYTINPFAEEGLAALFVTHPPVGERVRRLRELDPDLAREARAPPRNDEGPLSRPFVR